MAKDASVEHPQADNGLLSVVAPVYNVEEYLEQCLESILSQTYTHFELIIVNDGSTDGSPRICEAFAARDERITVVNQENAGLSCARNSGLECARGEYVCFIDSDDWLEPTFLERLYGAARREDVDIAICGYCIVEQDAEHPREVRFPEGPSDEHGFWTTALVPETLDIYVWNKLYRRSLIADKRFIPGKLCQDHAFNLEVFACATRVYFLSEPLYCYRRRVQSISLSSTYSTNLDVIEFDVAICRHLVEQGYDECLPSVLHRALNHLARKHPKPGDRAEEERYRSGRAAILGIYKAASQQGLITPSLRSKFTVYRLFGGKGYRSLSSFSHKLP